MNKIFHSSTERATTKNEYRLLILDDYNSHVFWQFVLACYNHKILSLCLSPYSTYLLQSLNVAIFESLQKLYDDLITQKSETNIQLVNKNLFINLYTQAREKSFRPEIIKIDFSVTDLVSKDSKEIYKRLSQMTRVNTFEPQLKSLASLSKSLAISAITNQIKLQIELLETLRDTSTIEIRLRKLEKEFAKIYANNILLSQQNKLLFAKNRIRKISKSKSHRLISNNSRLMTKKVALL